MPCTWNNCERSELSSRFAKGEKERAQTEDKQGSGKAFQENGDRENQATESLCQPHTHQEVFKEEEIPQDGDLGS